MADPRLEDHAIGVELQLTELTEELERARVQGRTERMADLEREIAALQDDLATTAEDYQKYAADEPVMSWLAGVRQLRNATWIDMPTSHWPMFSKPRELADHIAEVARTASNPVTA